MTKQLFFVLFLATVVLMVSANEPAKPAADAGAGDEPAPENGASMTTLTTASLMGLAFNILMNFSQ